MGEYPPNYQNQEKISAKLPESGENLQILAEIQKSQQIPTKLPEYQQIPTPNVVPTAFYRFVLVR